MGEAIPLITSFRHLLSDLKFTVLVNLWEAGGGKGKKWVRKLLSSKPSIPRRRGKAIFYAEKLFSYGYLQVLVHFVPVRGRGLGSSSWGGSQA